MDGGLIILVVFIVLIFLAGIGVAIYYIFFHKSGTGDDFLNLVVPPNFFPIVPTFPINTPISLVQGLSIQTNKKEQYKYLYADPNNCSYSLLPNKFSSCQYFNWIYDGNKVVSVSDSRELGGTISSQKNPLISSCVQMMASGKGADWVFEPTPVEGTNVFIGLFRLKGGDKYLASDAIGNLYIEPLPEFLPNSTPPIEYVWGVANTISASDFPCSSCLNPDSLITINQGDNYLFYKDDCGFLEQLNTSNPCTSYNWKTNLNSIIEDGTPTTVITADSSKNQMITSNIEDGKCPPGAIQGQPSAITVNSDEASGTNNQWYFNLFQGSYPTGTYRICTGPNLATSRCLKSENNFVYLDKFDPSDSSFNWTINWVSCAGCTS